MSRSITVKSFGDLELDLLASLPLDAGVLFPLVKIQSRSGSSENKNADQSRRKLITSVIHTV